MKRILIILSLMLLPGSVLAAISFDKNPADVNDFVEVTCGEGNYFAVYDDVNFDSDRNRILIGSCNNFFEISNFGRYDVEQVWTIVEVTDTSYEDKLEDALIAGNYVDHADLTVSAFSEPGPPAENYSLFVSTEIEPGITEYELTDFGWFVLNDLVHTFLFTAALFIFVVNTALVLLMIKR